MHLNFPTREDIFWGSKHNWKMCMILTYHTKSFISTSLWFICIRGNSMMESEYVWIWLIWGPSNIWLFFTIYGMMTTCDITFMDPTFGHMDWLFGGLTGFQSDSSIIGLPLLLVLISWITSNDLHTNLQELFIQVWHGNGKSLHQFVQLNKSRET